MRWLKRKPKPDPSTSSVQVQAPLAQQETRASGNRTDASFGAVASTAPSPHTHAIRDSFQTIGDVQEALRSAGLESSSLIFGIDFTKSNESAGRRSFGGRSLHCVDSWMPNPYQQATSAVAQTLADFDDDGLIPCYGFGDASTEDFGVFSFFPNDRPARGLGEVLQRYEELLPAVKMAGPTSFAPIIQQAMKIVVQSGMQYHILVIIADGQVTRGADTPANELSIQEFTTVEAIVEASHLPLSIVVIGVGDGPWDMMQAFDTKLPERQFDNLRFVNFTDLQRCTAHLPPAAREAVFARDVLMEVPQQYRHIRGAGKLGASDPGLGYLPQPLEPPYVPPPPKPLSPTPPDSPTSPFPTFERVLTFERAAAADVARPAGGWDRGGGGGAPLDDSARLSDHAEALPGRGASCVLDDGLTFAPDDLFICPITRVVMTDPVVAADGHAYERAAIERWLADNKTSYVTGEALPSTKVIPNHALRSAIIMAEEARERMSAL